MPGQPLLRIGQLAERTGVSVHVLRAWEKRYGLLAPERTPSGYRVYGPPHEAQVLAMQAHLRRGVSTAQAARAVRSGVSASAESGNLAADAARRWREDLRVTLERFDEAGADAVLDALLQQVPLESAIRDVVMPYLADLGDRWVRGRITVAHEHFASSLLRRRLGVLSAGWSSGNGPSVVLACPPGELHDLALLAFGVVLGRLGWRVRFLGGDTPIADIRYLSRRLKADLIVLAATRPVLEASQIDELATLGAGGRLVLAGAGATAHLAEATGARVLGPDPATAARMLHTFVPVRRR